MALIDTLKAKEMPSIYQVRPNLFAACYWVMKIGVAIEMLGEALKNENAAPGGLIMESTSGTMGYALAITGRALGMKVQLVGDPAIDPFFKGLLEQLGAQVHIVSECLPIGGHQIPRLRKLNELIDHNPGCLWVKQYDNPNNANSYRRTAAHIAASIGRIDIVVATVGSGGSISGTVRALRESGHPARAIAVDTHGSVLFGQEEGPRALRGLGNSIFPRNLDYSLIDEVHWVTAADAFCAARMLFADHGIDMGATTGAAFLVAGHLAHTNPGKRVVFLGPDRADRYLRTVYSRDWCRENGLFTETLPERPYRVLHPREAGRGWAVMHWNRRPIDEVVSVQTCGVPL